MREFFLNSDFDLTLNGMPSLLETSTSTYIHEMAWHYLFAASSQDSIVVHKALPKEFIHYIESKGIALPRITLHPSITAQACFTPFGWNSYTENRNRLYHEPGNHPALDIIEKANSRAFSQAIEQAWAEADRVPWSYEANGGIFDDLKSLEKFLHSINAMSTSTTHNGWMAKGNHGHAGTANRHIPFGPLRDEDKKWLAEIFASQKSLALEPWHERIMDMSANFEVELNGKISQYRGHELFNSKDGTFLGLKLLQHRQAPEPWNQMLFAAAERLGLGLAAIGYFGPVSMDAYVWQSPTGPILRPVVDINARHSMALPIHGIGRQLPNKIVLWIWMKPRKIILPHHYADLEAKLGLANFNPKTQTGILALSPLWTESFSRSEKRPSPPLAKRIGFLFSAEDESQLDNLRQHFIKALGKR